MAVYVVNSLRYNITILFANFNYNIGQCTFSFPQTSPNSSHTGIFILKLAPTSEYATVICLQVYLFFSSDQSVGIYH